MGPQPQDKVSVALIWIWSLAGISQYACLGYILPSSSLWWGERERERSKEGAGMSAKEQRIKGSNGGKSGRKKKARVTSLRASLLWSQVLLSMH
jgi:predicted alpha/beta superfamily hydrolase